MTTETPVGLIVEPVPMRGMGWLRDYPSCRDYTPRHDEVSPKRASWDKANRFARC
jgi:hypothetical protein